MMQAPPDAETPFIPPVGTPHHSPCTTLRKRSKETDKHYKDCQEFVSSKAAKHPSSKETEIEVNLVVIADKDRQFKKERARPRSACEKDVSSSYSEKNVFCFDEHSLRDADLSGKESSSEKEKAGKFLVEGVRVDKAKHFDSKDGGDKLRDSYSADCWKEGRVESGRWEFAADGRTFRPVGEDRREWTAGGMKEQPAQERRTMADDDVKYHHTALLKSSSQRLAGAAGVLHVTLPPPSMATSTPTTGSYTTELQWGVQQTPPPGAPPHSPGALSWHGEAPTSSDKSSETIPAPPPVRLSRKESYKAQRQNYRREKKRAATALLSTLEDPAVLILADWLKVRGSLKSWTKLWCVLKPGLLLLYKSPKAKSNHWVGTVLLSACHVIERPSKKDGFCFKLYNPLEKTIWAPRGPHNETIGAVVQPLPTAHLIFRAPSQAAGKCWLDGLELALRCSNTLLRSGGGSGSGVTGTVKSVDTTTNHETQWSPEDLEKHFNEQVLRLEAIMREYGLDTNLTCSNMDNISTSVNVDYVLSKDEVPSEQDSESKLTSSVDKWRQIVDKFDDNVNRHDCFSDDGSSDEVDNIYDPLLTAEETKSTDENASSPHHGVQNPSDCDKSVTKKRDSGFNFDFFKKNHFNTGSLRSKMFKEKGQLKSASQTPSKRKNSVEKSTIFAVSADEFKDKLKRSFSDPHEKPTVVLSAPEGSCDSVVEAHPTETHNFFEENLLKIVSAFPKRRSSTPSAFFKIGLKDDITHTKTYSLLSKFRHDHDPNKVDRRSNASFNEISITTDDVTTKKKNIKSYKNVPSDYLSGRKSAEPRMTTSLYDYQLVKDILSAKTPNSSQDEAEIVFRKKNAPVSEPHSRNLTPDKFSLINYKRLPSVILDRRMGEQNTDRHSQQCLYVAGKIVKETELDGPEVSDSDSEGDGALREAGGGLEEDELEHPGETSDRNGAGAAPDHADGVLAILKNVYADEDRDDVGQSGEVVEELGEENKSLLWFLIKQVRPGMDLSKVVLPTFILEPRSFLDKLADSFYHSDILARACRQTDAFERMKTVVTWYLSGLYRKPKGLKKPYNPVLGEAFRCCWIHPGTNTRTYYVAEQVSHHPPVSAFYVSNRKEGFAIEATILAKSKFYGNSTSAILEGIARVALLPLGESYLCSSPYAHCKGLLLGTLSMELGGRVTIYCPNTDYLADIEFKLKPFLGGSDCINMVSGRIKHHKETVATLEGHWDGRIDIKDKKTQEESPLLDVADLKQRRLRRQLVVPDRQGDFESQRLWRKVSQAIAQEDQVAATEEKTSIEEAQRERAREAGSREWVPKYFARLPPHQGLSIPQSHGGSAETSHPTFQYNFHNFTAWDEGVDVLEYEEEFVIKTLRRQPDSVVHQSRQQLETEHSGSESDSTNSHHVRAPSQGQQSVAAALLRLEAALNEQKQALAGVSAAVHRLEYPPMPVRVTVPLPSLRGSLIVLVLAVALHLVLLWVYSR